MTESNAVVHVLWATSPRYSDPHFITAFPDGLVDCWHEWYLELREKAEQDYRDFADDDGPWTFWTTVEHLPRPTSVPVEAGVDHG